MNARYDGFTQAPLFLSQGKLSWVSHLYDGVESSFETASVMNTLAYTMHTKLGSGNVKNILKFGNWGPPYYKAKKTFDGPAPVQSTENIQVQKKTA